MWPLCPNQHVAGAAQFQSSASDLESRAEVGNSFSAAIRGLATSVKSCSGGISRYAYARRLDGQLVPPQLIELGEPVTVGAVHDDGVRERNVDAVFMIVVATKTSNS